MADYISSYSGTEIETKLNQVKTDAELTTFINNILNTQEVQVNTINSKGLSIVIRKYGRICTCTVNGQLSVAVDSWVPFNPSTDNKLIPTGFRPAQEVYHHGPNTLYVINPNGTIYMSNAGTVGQWIQFSISYISD